jgi:hypothetical protein
MKPGLAAPRIAAVAALSLASRGALAQDIEPRAYTNAPIGINFLVAGYGRTEGGVTFDPAVPLTNARLSTDAGVFAYGRVFEVGGQSAKFNLVLPYVELRGTAEQAGKPVSREVAGFGDARLALSVNFLGAPALSPKDYGGYRQDLVVGGSVVLSLPTGRYDHDKLVNIGTNRWSIAPGLGLSKALGRWTLELMAAATAYGDNTDFFGGKRRQQDPIYSAQAHAIYSFTSGIWAALTATHYGGGRTTLDGVRKDDLQENSRIGATLALPIDRHNSIKFHASSGAYTRTGSNFDAYAIAWQHRWGAGF